MYCCCLCLYCLRCRNYLRLLSHLCHVGVLKKIKLKHNLRRRLTVALISTSAGPDVSVGRQSCLARLVGLLSWMSLVYRSSMLTFLSGRLFLLIILYVFLRNFSCPLQNIRAPRWAPLYLSIPVLALI